jgi:hypothetical protein
MTFPLPPPLLAAIDWGQVFFWSGAASVAVALVVLMRTRWGNGRIVAKCIILSIYAHILIALYVYTIDPFRARFRPPGNGTGDTKPYRVAVSPDAEAEEAPPTPFEEPWETTESLPNEQLAPELPEQSPVEAEEALAQERLQETPTETPTPSETPTDLTPPTPQDSSSDAPQLDEPPTESLASDPAATPAEEELKPIEASPTSVIASGRPMETERPAVPPPSAAPAPEEYKLRTAQNRMAIVRENGGDEDTEAAVQAALNWLADNQTADGRWDAKRHDLRKDEREGQVMGTIDTGITALAVLAFLANGETHLEGDHRESVQKGLEFLLSVQANDGNLAGHAGLPARTYCHGMATLALAECYAMTGDTRLKRGLERAIAYTIRAQHTGGGWRYTPASQGDMSQFGWQVMALKSAELGGISFPAENRRRSETFIKSVSSGRFGGLASYQARQRPSRVMTAESRVCQSLLQLRADNQAIEEANRFILEECPGEGDRNVYYWYYGTLALFHQRDGREWDEWNARLKTELCRSQRFDGRFAGSWDPDRTWGTYGGRVFQTSLSCLCLEVYYRYLPMYDESRAWYSAQRDDERAR